jgi:hypothetical protein
MPDPRQYVRPGQRLQIAASQINALNDMMRVKTGFRGGPQTAPEPAQNIVLIKNNSGADVPWLGVLGISGVEISPVGGSLTGNTDEDRKAREFASRPVLTGVAPLSSAHGWSIVIAMEPIASGSMGRAAVGGVFACRVFAGSAGRYATIKDGDVTQLARSHCGPVLLLWQQGEWAVGVM